MDQVRKGWAQHADQDVGVLLKGRPGYAVLARLNQADQLVLVLDRQRTEWEVLWHEPREADWILSNQIHAVGVAPDVWVLHLEVSGSNYGLRRVSGGIWIVEENTIIDGWVEALIGSEDPLGVRDQNDPDEEDKKTEAGEHDEGADDATESVDLKLKCVLAVWVNAYRVETWAAFVRTGWGRRTYFRVEGVNGLVLAGLADGIRVVILKGCSLASLAERSTVASEALSSVHNTCLT
jgi:hypothetical protein